MKRLSLLAFFLFAGLGAYAQAPGDDGPPFDGGPTPGTPNPTNNVPIDGGASLLLASGVAYGLKHLRQRQKKNTVR